MDWNIEGIAKRVIDEMREDQAPASDIEYYVHRIAYRTVYSRVPEDAELVSARVKKLVEESFDEA
jgi:hypothetical protein